MAEIFDIGRDTGTQVDPTYEGSPFPYTGELDRVFITLEGLRDTSIHKTHGGKT